MRHFLSSRHCATTSKHALGGEFLLHSASPITLHNEIFLLHNFQRISAHSSSQISPLLIQNIFSSATHQKSLSLTHITSQVLPSPTSSNSPCLPCTLPTPRLSLPQSDLELSRFGPRSPLGLPQPRLSSGLSDTRSPRPLASEAGA